MTPSFAPSWGCASNELIRGAVNASSRQCAGVVLFAGTGSASSAVLPAASTWFEKSKRRQKAKSPDSGKARQQTYTHWL